MVIIPNHYVPWDGYQFHGLSIKKYILKLMPYELICYQDKYKQKYEYDNHKNKIWVQSP